MNANEIKKKVIKRMWRLEVHDIDMGRELHNEFYATKEEVEKIVTDNKYRESGYHQVSIEEEDVIDEEVLDKAIELALRESETQFMLRTKKKK